MNTHLLWLILYCLILISIGLWVGRRVRSSGTFFVAERRLGTGLLFSTMLAANIGSGSTVGAAGLGFRDGLSAWWWVGAAGIGSIVLGLWVGPRIWKLASRHGLKTVGDFLEHRYGAPVRGLVAALLWVGTLAILAGQLLALATVLEAVAGIPKTVGCLIGGIVMTSYFASGGLLASAWVNLIQLGVLLAGFAIAVPAILGQVGGLSGLISRVPPPSMNFWQNGDSGWIYLTLLGPAFIVSPGLLQKIYGARDARTVRRAVTAQGFALMFFGFLAPVLGLSARLLHPDLANPESALPTLLVSDLPAIVGTIGLAAIVSAEISTCDAILFMLSTSLSQDLYKRFLNPAADDRTLLRVARLAALAGGILGVTLAIVSESIIQALSIFYAVLGICLFVPVLAGLFSRRGGSVEALSSILAGMAVMLTASLLDLEPAGINPRLLGLFASGAAFALVLVARGRQEKREASVETGSGKEAQ